MNGIRRNLLLFIIGIITIFVTACNNPFLYQNFGIALSLTDKDFGFVEYGYDSPQAQGVTVTNTGNRPTGGLTASLSGENADSFSLSKTSINSIETESGDSFTVVPKTGLSKGSYAAIVTVTGDNDIEAGFNVSFNVGVAPISDVSVTVTAPEKSIAPNTAATGDTEYSCGAVLWSPAPGYSQFQGGTKYTATVTLTANENYVFTPDFTAAINGFAADVLSNTGEKATISLEFDATLDKTVSAIMIKTQPANLTYTHGDTLNLSGLAVTLIFDDGTDEDFELANFGTTISTSLANGATLSRSEHDGDPVIVHYGSKSVSTGDLVVNKANPTVTWPTGLTALYGWTLTNISLPGNGTSSPAGSFTWAASSTSVGALGTGTHSMTFTPTDTANYNMLTQNVNIHVSLVEMVLVPGGSFQMGTPYSPISDDLLNEMGYYSFWGNFLDQTSDERPVHTVTLTSFYMGKYEVTQAQWQTVMGTTIQQQQTLAYNDNTEMKEYFQPSTNYGRGDNYPMYCVSWCDALVFCNKLSILEGLTPAYRISGSTDPNTWNTNHALDWDAAAWNAAEVVAGSTGYRLPTEAQWEYAAKGGNGSPGNYLYAGSDNINDVAWYAGNESGTVKPVGTKAPNGLGIYDMNGNVWEWCWDMSYAESLYNYPSDAQTDPTGPSSTEYNWRINRGGGWYSNGYFVRSAARGWNWAGYRTSASEGFRVIRP